MGVKLVAAVSTFASGALTIGANVQNQSINVIHCPLAIMANYSIKPTADAAAYFWC